MRRIKTLAAIGLAITGLGIAAGTAEATLTRDQAAWQEMTYECLRYTGCRDLQYYSPPLYMAGGACKQYYFMFHTTYYGWLYRTVGANCSPPYLR